MVISIWILLFATLIMGMPFMDWVVLDMEVIVVGKIMEEDLKIRGY